MSELEKRLVRSHKAAALVAAFILAGFIAFDIFVFRKVLLESLLVRLAAFLYMIGVYFVAERVPPKAHHWFYPVNACVLSGAIGLIVVIQRCPLHLAGMVLVILGAAVLVVDELRWTLLTVLGSTALGVFVPLLFLGKGVSAEFAKLVSALALAAAALALVMSNFLYRYAKELVLEKERSAKAAGEAERAASALMG